MMKSLPISVITVLMLVVLLNVAQPSSADSFDDWTRSLLIEENKTINGGDYIFYCTGHHGLLWSVIAYDSSGIHIMNGTTRHRVNSAANSLSDTLTFIKNNQNTIMWVFDSLLEASRLLLQPKDRAYNPIYDCIVVVKNNEKIFELDKAVSFLGPGSEIFNLRFGKLVYLMRWLAAPSLRHYIPMPEDDLSIEW